MTTAVIISLIVHYAQLYGLDPRLTLAVARTESNFNPRAISETNDYGVFQLNRESFKGYSEEQLLDPEVNIKLGIKYLAQMKEQCVHKDDISWLVCWNYGPENAKRVKHPNLFPFVKKVRAIMSEFKFKEGEIVTVKGLYELRLDGKGVYLGVSQEPHYKGYLRVQNEMGHVMLIHPDRVKKEE